MTRIERMNADFFSLLFSGAVFARRNDEAIFNFVVL